MREKMKKMFATTLAGFMAMSFVACGTTSGSGNGGNEGDGASGGDYTATYSYLAIDINPSIEFMINGETVVGVKACNDDASVLLSGENLENMSVSEATEKVVELAEELGYLTEENDDVKVVVTADTEEITTMLEELVKKGVGKGSAIAKINHTPRLTDERQVGKLKEEYGDKFKGLTPGKLRLIEAIMEYDETMTYEKGAEMSVSELSKMLDGLVDEMGDIIGDELKDLFENKYKEIKKLYDARIAELYGAEYKSAWERLTALEKVVKEIEKKAENLILSAEDVEKIMGIFGGLEEEPEEDLDEEPEVETEEEELEKEDEFLGSGYGKGEHGWHHGGHKHPELTEDGRLGLEDFEHYFDRHEHCHDNDKREEIFEKIEEILDSYDEDEYVLTEEDLTALEQAWGEPIEVTTFEDLEDFLDEQEELLEELRKSLTNPIIEELLRSLEKQMKGMKEEVKGYIKFQIEATKSDFQAQKEERRKGAR